MTTIRTEYPHPIREIENEWIPLADGTRLAARYWLPEDALDWPVPAILEYIPYGKRDGTAARDEAMHPYFAGHGYAAIRVDMRGSGESDGILEDEYLQRELDDAVEVIAWIAAQPWCTGRVGMMGKSWGGFNALQVAALRPPALACIITVASTDDRYADDVHYMGGCLNVSNLTWAFSMFLRNPRPPDSAVVGERWREMWRSRMAANQPWAIEWLRHQHRDAYWKHGSVCEDFRAIACPVYAIGGWADAYSNAIPRLMAGLQVPRKALIGPWGHQYPHQGYPGPAAGFLQDALRWWDHWLKDIDTGTMDEPAYRVWMQDYTPPRAFIEERPGRWVAEPGWPSESIRESVLVLGPGRLGRDPAPEEALPVDSPLTTGACGTSWIDSGAADCLDEPTDQREDDARSLVFDGDPLDEPLEILGAPVAELDLAADKPNALVCVRLCEVSPDGVSARVTYGLLNLTHRESHEHPAPLEPGRRYRVCVQLNDIAHRFAPGSRIRLAISTACWPVIWPSPERATVTVHTGSSRLVLPARPPREADETLPDLPPAEQSPVDPRRILRAPSPPTVTVTRDLRTGRVTTRKETDGGRTLIAKTGWVHGSRTVVERSIDDDDPSSARVDMTATVTFGREEGPELRLDLTHTVTADPTHFHLKATMEAYEDERPVDAKVWIETIRRNLV